MILKSIFQAFCLLSIPQNSRFQGLQIIKEKEDFLFCKEEKRHVVKTHLMVNNRVVLSSIKQVIKKEAET